MSHDLEPQRRRDEAARSTAFEVATPRWAAYAAFLVVVVLLVTVGLVGVLSMGNERIGGDVSHPITSAHVSTITPEPAAASSQPSPVILADIASVDLRTGKAKELPKRFRSIVGAAHFRVSRDGTMVAFDDGESIFVGHVDGTHLRRLTPDEGGVSAPGWSPDGSRLVFGQTSSAFILDIDTARIAPLVQERGMIWNPNFSPDGRTILYTTVRRGGLSLWTIPSTGGPRSFLRRGAFGAFSPDGSTIAYRKTRYRGSDPTEMTFGDIWLADADGSHARKLGHSCCWMSQMDPEALWPMWSPNGSKIAFQPLYKSPIKVIGVRFAQVRKVGEGTDPSWLDDHTLIVSDFRELGP